MFKGKSKENSLNSFQVSLYCKKYCKKNLIYTYKRKLITQIQLV